VNTVLIGAFIGIEPRKIESGGINLEKTGQEISRTRNCKLKRVFATL
jgi:hypothetical protein